MRDRRNYTTIENYKRTRRISGVMRDQQMGKQENKSSPMESMARSILQEIHGLFQSLVHRPIAVFPTIEIEHDVAATDARGIIVS